MVVKFRLFRDGRYVSTDSISASYMQGLCGCADIIRREFQVGLNDIIHMFDTFVVVRPVGIMVLADNSPNVQGLTDQATQAEGE